MVEAPTLSLIEIARCLSGALDLVCPQVVDHHRRVAALAAKLAKEAGLGVEERRTILLAGLLHDLGALTPRERLETLSFDLDRPQLHAERGAELLGGVSLFGDAAELVRHHHLPWERGAGAELGGRPVPWGSHVLHLADRIAVLLDPAHEILEQRDAVVERIRGRTGAQFDPVLVDAFRRLAATESFWFDALAPDLDALLLRERQEGAEELYPLQLLGITRLFGHLIDCRSRFTARHSSGVAAVAGHLGALAGLPEEQRGLLEIAGHVHDLGKLGVPPEILEKPAALTVAEMNVMRRHPYETYRLLAPVDGLRPIARWGALHHERLDGTGYPFHYSREEIPFGSRVMAVADVFTALSEDRPYRAGMSRGALTAEIGAMSRAGTLDAGVVALATARYDEIEEVRRAAQEARGRAIGPVPAAAPPSGA